MLVIKNMKATMVAAETSIREERKSFQCAMAQMKEELLMERQRREAAEMLLCKGKEEELSQGIYSADEIETIEKSAKEDTSSSGQQENVSWLDDVLLSPCDHNNSSPSSGNSSPAHHQPSD